MSGKDPFTLPNLHFTRPVEESKQISHFRQGAVILAGSGMCTGGRVRHHLRHNLWRPESSVVFVGFAVEETLARTIIDGAQQVRLFGEDVIVKAQIYTLNGFSAHAGQSELLSWHSDTGTPRTTFLVHGEPKGGMAAMADCLKARGATTVIPTLHQRVALD
jgi:metallo-beta-lactamase family protein